MSDEDDIRREERLGVLGNMLSGGTSGASIGSFGGPWGTAIGAGVGALAGLGVGIADNRRMERDRLALEGQQDELQAQLDAVNNTEPMLASANISAGLQSQAAQRQARDLAAQGGLNPFQAQELQQDATRNIQLQNLQTRDSIINLGRQQDIAERQQIMMESEGAQRLADRGYSPGYGQQFGAAMGALSQLSQLGNAVGGAFSPDSVPTLNDSALGGGEVQDPVTSAINSFAAGQNEQVTSGAPSVSIPVEQPVQAAASANARASSGGRVSSGVPTATPPGGAGMTDEQLLDQMFGGVTGGIVDSISLGQSEQPDPYATSEQEPSLSEQTEEELAMRSAPPLASTQTGLGAALGAGAGTDHLGNLMSSLGFGPPSGVSMPDVNIVPEPVAPSQGNTVINAPHTSTNQARVPYNPYISPVPPITDPVLSTSQQPVPDLGTSQQPEPYTGPMGGMPMPPYGTPLYWEMMLSRQTTQNR